MINSIIICVCNLQYKNDTLKVDGKYIQVLLQTSLFRLGQFFSHQFYTHILDFHDKYRTFKVLGTLIGVWHFYNQWMLFE